MIRFALVVASVLGFVLTAALGNMMVPLLRELQRAARGTQPDSDDPDSPVPTMGGLCLMVGTLAAVGVGWLAACAAQPSLLGSDRQMTSRLLIALLGSLAFGAVGLADDLARIRGRYPNGLGLGLRRTQRLALECIAAVLVLGLLALNGCLPTGLILPGAGYVECALAPLLWAVLLVAMAEAARGGDRGGGIPGGRRCRRHGVRRGLCGHAGPDDAGNAAGLVPAGSIPGGTGRCTDGLSAVGFSTGKAAPRPVRLLVCSGSHWLHSAVHWLRRAEHPAGTALLGGGRHGGAAGPVLPLEGQAAVWRRAPRPRTLEGQAAVCGGTAAPLAGKARHECSEYFLQPVRTERVRAGAGRVSGTLGLSA